MSDDLPTDENRLWVGDTARWLVPPKPGLRVKIIAISKSGKRFKIKVLPGQLSHEHVTYVTPHMLEKE